MIAIDKPNKVTATLKVVVTGEFYDPDATDETLRYCVEQTLEDAGFDVDVSVWSNKQEFNIMENNHVHLCNSCFKSYPDCSDDEHAIEFGDGIGGDNICCCNKYEPLLERDYERGGYK